MVPESILFFVFDLYRFAIRSELMQSPTQVARSVANSLRASSFLIFVSLSDIF